MRSLKNSHLPLGRRLQRQWPVFVAILVIVAVGFAGIGYFRQGAPLPSGQRLIVATLPPSPTAQQYFDYGNDEFDQGHYQAAIAAYGSAIALKPDYAEAYNNRAYTYMTQQNYASALTDLDKAIALRPDYVNALMNRGDIYNYYYQIAPQKALADYDRVVVLDPNHTSLCGHRLLAEHGGWNLGTLGDLIMHGTQAGCQGEG